MSFMESIKKTIGIDKARDNQPPRINGSAEGYEQGGKEDVQKILNQKQYVNAGEAIKRDIFFPEHSVKKDGDFSFLDSFNRNYQKPEPVNNKKLQSAKIMGALADTFGLLSQTIGASRGAYVQPQTEFSLSKIAANEKQTTDQYKQELANYNKAKMEAEINDYQMALQKARDVQNQFNVDRDSKFRQDTADRDFKQREESLKNERENLEFERKFRDKNELRKYLISVIHKLPTSKRKAFIEELYKEHNQ